MVAQTTCCHLPLSLRACNCDITIFYCGLLLQDTNIQAILEDLMKGTEQLLFSFIVPSTFCSTDNIVELQKLVTQGWWVLYFSSSHLFLDVFRLQ